MRNPSQKFLEAEGPGVSESTQAPGGVAPSRGTGPQAQATWNLRFFERVRSNEPKSHGFVSTPPGLNFRNYPLPYPRCPRADYAVAGPSAFPSLVGWGWGGQELISGRVLQRTPKRRAGLALCPGIGGQKGWKRSTKKISCTIDRVELPPASTQADCLG